MKKLTAGIFATILGLTAVDAFAAPVASTDYVQSALETLDSTATATSGSALTGITVVDGKITGKTEVVLPVDTNTTYTAGKFVNIDKDNVITTTYTAGTNVQISEDGVISATDNDTKYSAGTNVQISTDGTISATDTTYTAGKGMNLNGNEFSANVASVASGSENVTVTNENGIFKVSVAADQDTTYKAGKFVNIDENNVITTTYTAGTNVQISADGAISATDTTYTAGDGITLTGNTFSANVNKIMESFDSEATGGTNTLLSGVKLVNGELKPGQVVQIVDVYPYKAPVAE